MNKRTQEEEMEKALKIAQKNLASGNWTVETAQLWLAMVEQQPEDACEWRRT